MRHNVSYCLATALLLALLGGTLHAERFEVYIPQIADGGGWATQIIMTATNNSVGSVEFFNSDGKPLILDVDVSDLGTLRTNAHIFNLGERSTKVIQTKNLGSTTAVGFAKVTYDAETEAVINGTFQSFQGRSVPSEAGINVATITRGSLLAPLALTPTINVGLALVGLDSIPNQCRLILIDDKGRQISAATVDFQRHFSFFVTLIFPEVAFRSFNGSLRIIPYTGAIVATALRLSSNGLSVSSTPVGPQAPARAPLLTATVEGSNVLLLTINDQGDLDSVDFELQVAAPLTLISTHPGVEPIWASIPVFGNVARYRLLASGNYAFRARAWNGKVAGPFSLTITAHD